MAAKSTETPNYTPTAMTPPPINRGRRETAYPPEFIEGVIAQLNAGEFVGDGVVYDGDGDPDKAKQRANTAATRLKKRLINDPNTPWEDPKALRQRVWEDSEGKFVFSLNVRKT